MNSFVATCRREWRRIGVPEAAANEMATDLDADLTEAEADGVSPEEVLGIGYFDPESFAAAWARARGIVEDPQVAVRRAGGRRRAWALGAAAVVFSFVALAGLAVAVGRQHASVAVAGVSFHRLNISSDPGPLVGPQRLLVMHAGAPVVAGLVLLIGLLGLGITLWLGRHRISRRGRGPTDPDIGMPSFL